MTAGWTFLTNHARALLCISDDPGVRLRDIADRLGITERSAYGIVTDLTRAGYIVKVKDGRRNRYQIQAHLPLPEPTRRNEPSARSWRCWPATNQRRLTSPRQTSRPDSPGGASAPDGV